MSEIDTSDKSDNSGSESNDENTGDVTPGVIPRVVKFAYRDFHTDNKGKWIATCSRCRKTLSDTPGVTSAFTK